MCFFYISFVAFSIKLGEIMENAVEIQTMNLTEHILDVLRQAHFVIGQRLQLINQNPNGEQSELYQKLRIQLAFIDEMMRLGRRPLSVEDQVWLKDALEKWLSSLFFMFFVENKNSRATNNMNLNTISMYINPMNIRFETHGRILAPAVLDELEKLRDVLTRRMDIEKIKTLRRRSEKFQALRRQFMVVCEVLRIGRQGYTAARMQRIATIVVGNEIHPIPDN
ncbi:hypothetical protein L5515_018503 [Caenorhabditis briggsae]|uniref:Uncharacterized protein n=1 Tax=Caenorhabditis briggsae TaxID=6238 RepID=A0AAE9FCI5_CAEBR|nr:hypothetical protein L5515_018503 [Caenorhabditis briggsae]